MAVAGLLTLFAARAPGAAPAADVNASLDRFVREFESSYRDVRSLRAEFTQTYILGGRTRVESGTVYFARHGLMRWDYRKPEEKLFLSDGKNLLLFIPAEKQMARSAVKSTEDVRLPFRLLLSRLDLRRVFSRIEFADKAAPRTSEDHVLKGYPKRGAEDEYREIVLEITPGFDIRRLAVTFVDQSVMEFQFERIQRDVALQPGLFRFLPPAGTEIIDQ